MEKKNKSEIEDYITSFFRTRSWYWDFFNEIRREYRSHSKPIQDTRIISVMNFIESVEGNLGYLWEYESLIPEVFPTERALAQFVNSFSDYIVEKSEKICNKYEEKPYFIDDMQRICRELVEFFQEIVKRILIQGDVPMPYLQLRETLLYHNMDSFKDKFNSLLGELSYNIRHNMDIEAYFHICTHLILRMIGFEINSEDETDLGRMDSSINLPTSIYIFEYKYSDNNEDRSQEALQQIFDKRYADKFKLSNKPIYCVGFSFGKTSHHIDYLSEQKITV